MKEDKAPAGYRRSGDFDFIIVNDDGTVRWHSNKLIADDPLSEGDSHEEETKDWTSVSWYQNSSTTYPNFMSAMDYAHVVEGSPFKTVDYYVYLKPDAEKAGQGETDKNTRLVIRGDNIVLNGTVANNQTTIYRVDPSQRNAVKAAMKAGTVENVLGSLTQETSTPTAGIKKVYRPDPYPQSAPGIIMSFPQDYFAGDTGYLVKVSTRVTTLGFSNTAIKFDWFMDSRDSAEIANNLQLSHRIPIANKMMQVIADHPESRTNPTLTVYNQAFPDAVLNLEKTDIHAQPLGNAKFGLYNEYGHLIAVQSSDQEGKLKFESLTPGKYQLREMEAPEGYVPSGITYNLVVDEDRLIHYTGKNRQGEIVDTGQGYGIDPKDFSTTGDPGQIVVKSQQVRLRDTIPSAEKPYWDNVEGRWDSWGAEDYILEMDLALNKVKVGQSFTIDFDDHLDFKKYFQGVPNLVGPDGSVIAYGTKDLEKNRFTWRFTDYVLGRDEMNLTLSLAGFVPSPYYATHNGNYTFHYRFEGLVNGEGQEITDTFEFNSNVAYSPFSGYTNEPQIFITSPDNVLAIKDDDGKTHYQFRTIAYLNPNGAVIRSNEKLYIHYDDSDGNKRNGDPCRVFPAEVRFYETYPGDATMPPSMGIRPYKNGAYRELVSLSLNQDSTKQTKTSNGASIIFQPGTPHRDNQDAPLILVPPHGTNNRQGYVAEIFFEVKEDYVQDLFNKWTFAQVDSNYNQNRQSFQFHPSKSDWELLGPSDTPDIYRTLTIRAVNRPAKNGAIKLTKVDQNQPGKKLAGAVFKLWDAEGNLVAEDISDTAGQVAFDKLQPGEYTLTEEVAPTGYARTETRWRVRVDENGSTAYHPFVEDTEGLITNDSGEITFTTPIMKSTGSSGSGELVYIDRSEAMNLDTTLSFNGAKKGQYFELVMDEKLDLQGLVSPYTPPDLIDNQGRLLAVADTHVDGEGKTHIVYTLVTDVTQQGIELKLPYLAFKEGPDGVERGTYTLKNNLAGKEMTQDVKVGIEGFRLVDNGAWNYMSYGQRVQAYNPETMEVTYLLYLGPKVSGVSYGPDKETRLVFHGEDGVVFDKNTKIQTYRIKEEDKDQYMSEVMPSFQPREGLTPLDIPFNVDKKSIDLPTLKRDSGERDGYIVLVRTHVDEDQLKAGVLPKIGFDWLSLRNGEESPSDIHESYSKEKSRSTVPVVPRPKTTMPDLTIGNEPLARGGVSVKKVDGKDQSLLDGAEFTLKNARGEVVATKVSGKDSKGMITFSDLAPGRYTLEETAAPKDYAKSRNIWTIDVDNEGTIKVYEGLMTTGGENINYRLTSTKDRLVASRLEGDNFALEKKDYINALYTISTGIGVANGDSFTVEYINMSPYDPRKEKNPSWTGYTVQPIQFQTADGQTLTIAKGQYDRKTNTTTYTFTREAEKARGWTFTINENLALDTDRVLHDGTYNLGLRVGNSEPYVLSKYVTIRDKGTEDKEHTPFQERLDVTPIAWHGDSAETGSPITLVDGAFTVENNKNEGMYFDFVKQNSRLAGQEGKDATIRQGLLGLTFTGQTKDGNQVIDEQIFDLSKEETRVWIPSDWDGEFTITETQAPNGYEKTDESYTIVINQAGKTITWKEKKGDGTTADTVLYRVDEKGNPLALSDLLIQDEPVITVNVHKVDEANQPLKDASFALFGKANANLNPAKGTVDEPLKDKNGNPLEQTTGEKGDITFKNLEPGTYYLKETKAPRGYSLLYPVVKLEVTASAVTATVVNEDGVAIESKLVTILKPEGDQVVDLASQVDIQVKNRKAGFKIKKVDANGDVLEGAAFSLKFEGDTTFPMTYEGKGVFSINSLRVPSFYMLREDKAPEGYQLPSHQWAVHVREEGVKIYELPFEPIWENDGYWITDKRWTNHFVKDGETDTTQGIEYKKGDPLDYVPQGYHTNPYRDETVWQRDAITGLTIKARDLSMFYDFTKEYKSPDGLDHPEDKSRGPKPIFEASFGDTLELAEPYSLKNYENKLTVYKVDEDGKPLPGAKFGIYTLEQGEYKLKKNNDEDWVQTTDENGRTTFTHLSYGDYYLGEVSAPEGYQPASIRWHIVIDSRSGKFTVTKTSGREDLPSTILMPGDKYHVPGTAEGEEVTIEVPSVEVKNRHDPPEIEINKVEMEADPETKAPVVKGPIVKGTLGLEIALTEPDEEGAKLPANAKTEYEWDLADLEPELDEQGQPKKDGEGKPIYKTDESGQPIYKKHKMVLGWDWPTGIYTIKETKAPEGFAKTTTEYQVRLEKGTGSTRKLVRWIDDKASDTLYDEGKIQKPLVIENEKFSGKVVVDKKNEAGEALPGVTFTLYPVGSSEVAKDVNGKALTGVTDASGHLEFTQVPSGRYELKEVQTAEGYILPEGSYSVLITRAMEVPSQPDPDNPNPRDVSDQVAPGFSVGSLTTSGEEQGVLHQNRAESLYFNDVTFQWTGEEDIKAGDYFYLDLSPNLDLNGIEVNDPNLREYDIVTDLGILARAEYERDKHRIKYTFTEYLKYYSMDTATARIAAFVDAKQVPPNKSVTVGLAVGQNDKRKGKQYNVYVDYDDYRNDPDSGDNDHVLYIRDVDVKQGTFRAVDYVFPNGLNSKKEENKYNAQILVTPYRNNPGDSSASFQGIGIDDVHVYYVDRTVTYLPPSFGISEDKLGEDQAPRLHENDKLFLPGEYYADSVYINFQNELREKNKAAIVIVDGKYDKDSPRGLQTGAWLYWTYDVSMENPWTGKTYTQDYRDSTWRYSYYRHYESVAGSKGEVTYNLANAPNQVTFTKIDKNTSKPIKDVLLILKKKNAEGDFRAYPADGGATRTPMIRARSAGRNSPQASI